MVIGDSPITMIYSPARVILSRGPYFFLISAASSAWESNTSTSKSLSVLCDPHSLLWIVLVVCYNYPRVG